VGDSRAKEWKMPVRNPDMNSTGLVVRDYKFACAQIVLWISVLNSVPDGLIDDERFSGDSDGGCPGDACHSGLYGVTDFTRPHSAVPRREGNPGGIRQCRPAAACHRRDEHRYRSPGCTDRLAGRPYREGACRRPVGCRRMDTFVGMRSLLTVRRGRRRVDNFVGIIALLTVCAVGHGSKIIGGPRYQGGDDQAGRIPHINFILVVPARKTIQYFISGKLGVRDRIPHQTHTTHTGRHGYRSDGEKKNQQNRR